MRGTNTITNLTCRGASSRRNRWRLRLPARPLLGGNPSRPRLASTHLIALLETVPGHHRIQHMHADLWGKKNLTLGNHLRLKEKQRGRPCRSWKRWPINPGGILGVDLDLPDPLRDLLVDIGSYRLLSKRRLRRWISLNFSIITLSLIGRYWEQVEGNPGVIEERFQRLIDGQPTISTYFKGCSALFNDKSPSLTICFCETMKRRRRTIGRTGHM